MAKSAVVTTGGGGRGAVAEQQPSLVERIRGFFHDVRGEMKKVSVPSRKEVQATTLVVIVTVFIFAAYFWIVDFALGRGIDQVLRYFINK